MTQLTEEQQVRQEAICRFCDQKIHLAGDEWRHSFNESLWCRPTTATPLLDSDSQAAGASYSKLAHEIISEYNNADDPGLLRSKVAEGFAQVANAMRDKCVEKVRALPDHSAMCGVWLQQVCDCDFRTEAIKAIQSLTPDQVKPGEM